MRQPSSGCARLRRLSGLGRASSSISADETRCCTTRISSREPWTSVPIRGRSRWRWTRCSGHARSACPRCSIPKPSRAQLAVPARSVQRQWRTSRRGACGPSIWLGRWPLGRIPEGRRLRPPRCFSAWPTSLAGFAISDRFVLGNFSYAKLPMVKDLESATEALVQNELICAIAGDEAARDAVRSRHPAVSLDEPDHTPVADEFLVLDADASQSYVINAVVKGADLVVEGPPGTGKSQTIANLIATLAARGQRVLFVAEKRAAIDAVLDRLRNAGLADLVLDLHDGAGSRRKLAQDLSHALAEVGRVPIPTTAELQDKLVRYRDELVERTAAVHNERQPWGLSVYE